MPTEEELLAEIEAGVAALDLPQPAWQPVPDARPRAHAPPPEGCYSISLHTAEPNEGGEWHEASFGGYERATIERSPVCWQVLGGCAQNRKTVEFPECTGGEEILTHFGLIDHQGMLLVYGRLSYELYVGPGIQIIIPPEGIGIEAP